MKKVIDYIRWAVAMAFFLLGVLLWVGQFAAFFGIWNVVYNWLMALADPGDGISGVLPTLGCLVFGAAAASAILWPVLMVSETVKEWWLKVAFDVIAPKTED